LKTNSTYLDCPIANYANEVVTIAIHNPSSLDASVAQVAVPNGKYSVESYDD